MNAYSNRSHRYFQRGLLATIKLLQHASSHSPLPIPLSPFLCQFSAFSRCHRFERLPGAAQEFDRRMGTEESMRIQIDRTDIFREGCWPQSNCFNTLHLILLFPFLCPHSFVNSPRSLIVIGLTDYQGLLKNLTEEWGQKNECAFKSIAPIFSERAVGHNQTASKRPASITLGILLSPFSCQPFADSYPG
jgi:hypothetical protein